MCYHVLCAVYVHGKYVYSIQSQKRVERETVKDKTAKKGEKEAIMYNIELCACICISCARMHTIVYTVTNSQLQWL